MKAQESSRVATNEVAKPTSMVMAHIAGGTSTIRVGAGGAAGRSDQRGCADGAIGAIGSSAGSGVRKEWW